MQQYANIAALAGVNIAPENDDIYSYYPDLVNSNTILDSILTHKFKTGQNKSPVTLYEFWNIKVDSSEIGWKHKLDEETKKNLRENHIFSSIDNINRLFTISVKIQKDPVIAAELANYIAKQIDRYNKKTRKLKTNEQIKFIEEGIAKNTVNLKKAEKIYKEFIKTNKDISSVEQQIQKDNLETELTLQRTLYVELRKQLELTRIEQVKQTETLTILDNAVVPIHKIRPKRALIVILGFLLALSCSSFYILFIRTQKNHIEIFINILKKNLQK